LNSEANAELLRQIGLDIRKWREGSYPPGKALFLLVWGVPTLVSVLLVENMSVQLTSALVSACSLIIAWRVTATAQKPGGSPRQAAVCVQATKSVRLAYFSGCRERKGGIALNDVQRWYESECATVGRTRKMPLHFLDNNANRSTDDKQNKAE
jgi:hypothetical protein